MEIADLPGLNAILNAASALFLLLGFSFVKRGRVAAHKKCMLAALVVSALFLTSYLVYHFHHPANPFPGAGWARPAYYSILFSHILGAISIVVLVPIAVVRAWRGDFVRHKRIARWTFPIWVYVSVTGVLVYLMLYRWYS